MIGFVGGVGRVALTQAGRQVGRQFGREVLERLVGGERLGDFQIETDRRTNSRTRL